MACERVRDALADVAAGEPAPAAVEAHVRSCEACRLDLATLRRALAVADEELAGLAAAEPAPDLAVRIRQAVDASERNALQEGPLHALRFARLWPAMAAAATLLVALAVVISRGQTPGPGPRMAEATPRPQPSATIRTPESADGPFNPQASTERLATVVTPRSSGQVERRGVRSPVGSLGTRRTGVPREGRAPEPEVLVPPGEGEALLRFVALVHRDRLAPAGLGTAGQPSADLAVLKPIDIPPLEIVPLDPAETSGT